MDELKKHSLLLTLLASLMVTKFIIVPIYQWQDNMLERIQLLTKKKVKIDNLLKQEARFNSEAKKIKGKVEQADSVFFAYEEESDFKLTQQKLLEELLAKYELRASNIGWQITTAMPELKSTNYQLRIQFSGDLLNLLNFMAVIETYQHKIQISDFYFSVRNQSNNELGSTNGWFILNFYANSVEPPQKIAMAGNP